MNFKQHIKKFNHFITRTFVLVVSLSTILLCAFTVYSNEDNYQLIKVAQLEHQLLSQPKWLQLIANPSNKQQHFVIREAGQVYFIDNDEINPKAILDMSVNLQTDLSIFKLTAIELHPNFSLRDQVGYGTFYTAHIENINENSKTKRIQERVDDLQLNFDAVITEWKFSAVNHQKVDVNTKREVLRIGVPDNLMVIKQLSFSPYVKSWNAGFGLLYVALNGGEAGLQPLYSGVILRIDPAKFGMRSFRVPNNNPYMKNSQIHDAIYLLGGQKIKQFIWPQKNSEHILVSHQYNNKYLLSLTDGLNDWRDSQSKQILYQSDDAIHDLLMYHGRQLPLLRSKLLLLRHKEQYWFIDSLAFNFSENKKKLDRQKPQIEWSITSEQLPSDSLITLSRNHSGEIFLLEKTIGVLFRLTHQTLVNENIVVESGKNNTIETNSSSNRLFILLLLLVLLGTFYYWFMRNRHLVKVIVRHQFAVLELSETGLQISLYHRHQKNAETVIDIVDIVSSEIKFNEHSISIINDQPGHGFNNDREQDLRAIFVNEKTNKMVDGKVRQISLLLTDKQKSVYTVCLYMREGNDRITKKPYALVIDELMDWCWLIGEKVNADNTDIRRVKSKALPKEKTGIESNHIKAPLDSQAATIRPATLKIDNDSQPLVTGELSPSLNVVNEDKYSADDLSGKENTIDHHRHQNNTIDTELVNALERLVNLKQKGFLTMDEFSKAKEKLLKTLFKK